MRELTVQIEYENLNVNTFVESSIEFPRIHTILPIHQLVNETDTFEIFCNATGYPLPTITWRKNDNNSKVHPTGKTLRVENADKSDFGAYQCTALSIRGDTVSAMATVELDYCKSVLGYLNLFSYNGLSLCTSVNSLLVNGMERTNHIADVMNCMRDITWCPLTLILTKTQKKKKYKYLCQT